MDLGDIKIEENAEKGMKMFLTVPSSMKRLKVKGKDLYIKLVGTDSRRFRDAKDAINREIAKDDERSSRLLNDDEIAELLAECVVDWYVVENKEDVPFTKENAIKLFKQHRWLLEDANLFIANRGNFI